MALQAVADMAAVVGVVAHPPDPEDGVRYESVFAFAKQRGWNVTRGKGKDPQTFEFVRAAKPDLLWITDFRYLLPQELIAFGRTGAVNLHPSLLPRYRGRAPVNWAILHGETKLGLTAHFVDEGMDTGDIIEQVSFEISEDQDVGDCLEILYPLYTDITKRTLNRFLSGSVPRIVQDHSLATAFPARRPADGLIDWRQSARSVHNLVRAVAAPYPGAFTSVAGKKLLVWKARVRSDCGADFPPGCVVNADESGISVQCGTGVLDLLKIEIQDQHQPVRAGTILG